MHAGVASFVFIIFVLMKFLQLIFFILKNNFCQYIFKYSSVYPFLCMGWDFLINHLPDVFYTILFFLFFSSCWVLGYFFLLICLSVINPVFKNIQSLTEHSWPNFKYKYCIFICRMSTKFFCVDFYWNFLFLIHFLVIFFIMFMIYFKILAW